MCILRDYVAAGFLTPAVAKSLSKYGPDKLEDAVQAAAEAGLRRLDPLAAARREVEPEFSSATLHEIGYFYQQMADDDAELEGAGGGDRLADTSRIAAALGVGRRRAQQILRTTLFGMQDEHQLQLFGGVR